MDTQTELWRVVDSAGKDYGTFDRKSASDLVGRVFDANPDLEGIGMTLVGCEELAAEINRWEAQRRAERGIHGN